MVKIDDSLNIYQNTVLEMARKVRMMHVLAMEVMSEGNVEKALSIIKMDDFVNNYEEEINDKAVETLALLAPVATDLRIVIAGIKIASDLERIGDYAKNIAEYVIRHGQVDTVVLQFSQLIVEDFLSMYDHTISAYEAKDAKKAFEIPLEDEKINERFNELVETLDQMVSQNKKIAHLVQMVAMLRNIERSGDHTKNICEHLIYQVKGQHFDFH